MKPALFVGGPMDGAIDYVQGACEAVETVMHKGHRYIRAGRLDGRWVYQWEGNR